MFDFVIKKSIPLVGILNANSGAVYSKQTNPIVTIFTSIDLEKNWKGFQYIANRVRKVAKEFTNKLVFNVANLGDFAYEMSTMYDIITPNPKSTYVGLKEDKTYYHMIESFSVDHLQSFVQQFLAHELQGKVYEGSEASSEDDKDSSVVTLTNENFQSIVEDSSQDILVEFYAPWCGHCQALKPEYRKVADYFNNVIIFYLFFIYPIILFLFLFSLFFRIRVLLLLLWMQLLIMLLQNMMFKDIQHCFSYLEITNELLFLTMDQEMLKK